MRARQSKRPAEFTLAIIGGGWKIPLIFHLLAGVKRFSELFRALPGVTQKMRTQQLREMERNGFVQRKVHAQVSPKVEYSLTPLRRSLKLVIDAMCRWGALHGLQTAGQEAQS